MLLCFGFSEAQLHDNVWLFGFESYTNTDGVGGSVLDFSGDSLDIFYEYRDMDLNITNAGICDTSGNLLFYTNGIYIANALHEPMENGEGLNPGEYADAHFWLGYRVIQGAIIVPAPGVNDKYYLIHESYEYPTPNSDWHAPIIYYSLIDLSYNNGLGAVIEKNQIIFEGVFDHGKITLVKHANGRDWWGLILQRNSSCFNRFLITSNGIETFPTQCIGGDIPGGIGQSVYSPDGSKYVLYNLVSVNIGNYLSIYDFDRCNGELSNPIQDILIDTAGIGGVAISPNSRYLYVSSYNYIYQYDLEADDILSTKDTVAIYDGYEVEVSAQNNVYLPTRFSLIQLGPNGKIYIKCSSSANLLHVINQPDSAGVACEVFQHHIELPTYNRSLPNFPNYRLGALEGSGCDTITSINQPVLNQSSLSTFPNPTSSTINFSFDDIIKDNLDLTIFNIAGQQIAQFKLEEGQKAFRIDLGRLSSGIYFYEISNKDINHSGKLTILK